MSEQTANIPADCYYCGKRFARPMRVVDGESKPTGEPPVCTACRYSDTPEVSVHRECGPND